MQKSSRALDNGLVKQVCLDLAEVRPNDDLGTSLHESEGTQFYFELSKEALST
jgi:hypothetical protein